MHRQRGDDRGRCPPEGPERLQKDDQATTVAGRGELADQGGGHNDGPVVTTFWGAMRTIVIGRLP